MDGNVSFLNNKFVKKSYAAILISLSKSSFTSGVNTLSIKYFTTNCYILKKYFLPATCSPCHLHFQISPKLPFPNCATFLMLATSMACIFYLSTNFARSSEQWFKMQQLVYWFWPSFWVAPLWIHLPILA